MGKAHPVGRHAVGARDGPQGDHVLIGPSVAHDAHRLDGKQHRQLLPDVIEKSCVPDLLAEDRIGLSDDGELVLRDGAQDAHRQSRPREGVPPDEGLGEAQFATELPDLVLEEDPERLHERHLELCGKASHVVVALDDDGGAPE